MDRVIAELNEKCPVELARRAIAAYLEVRIFPGDTIPDPEVEMISEREVVLSWRKASPTGFFYVSVDLNAGARERPDKEVTYGFDDFRSWCGLGYDSVDERCWKHLADMYPEFAATLGDEFFSEETLAWAEAREARLAREEESKG